MIEEYLMKIPFIIIVVLSIVCLVLYGFAYIIIPEIISNNDKLEKANKAFRCPNVKCEKLIRKYQMDLYRVNKQTCSCPHCGYSDDGTYKSFKKVKIYDPWMDTVVDSPLIKMKTFRSINKTIKTIKRNRADMETQLRFEEYHKLNPNIEWVKNISSIEWDSKVSNNSPTGAARAGLELSTKQLIKDGGSK